MSIVAPKGRKPLSAEALLGLIRTGFALLPDHRFGGADISCTDALLSAVAMFSLQSPSLRAFDKERAEGHWETVDGSERVPCDTPMREILDPVSPESLRPLFPSVFRPRQRGQALAPMVLFAGGDLLALDGTGYCSSQTMHGASGLPKVHRHGSMTYAHQLLGAAIVHPECRDVIPVMPEALVKPDGAGNNDGERHAANRFMTT